MEQEDSFTKLAQIINANLDSKIKSHFSAQPLQLSVPVNLKIEDVHKLFEILTSKAQELDTYIDKVKEELDEISRIKAALVLTSVDSLDSDLNPEEDLPLFFEKVEKRCEEIVQNLLVKEEKWKREEERIYRERVEYQRQCEILQNNFEKTIEVWKNAKNKYSKSSD